MSHAELQNMIIAALYSAPKPLTEETALHIAQMVMIKMNAHVESGQFAEWFKKNGASLVKRLNG